MPWSCLYERRHAAHLTRHTPNTTIDTSIPKEKSALRPADTVYVVIRAPSRSAVLPVLPVPRESLMSVDCILLTLCNLETLSSRGRSIEVPVAAILTDEGYEGLNCR